MFISYGFVLAALWLAWLAYWIASASGVKTVASEGQSWQQRLGYSVPLWVAAILLVGRSQTGFLAARFLPHADWLVLLGVVLTAAGLAVAIWARRYLGRNWSADIVVKHDHELIRTGPYAYARHPIYTGLALAFLGTAIAVGEWRALLALVIAIASFWYKLGLEERVMTETFGAAYEDYRRWVKALIPFVI